MTRVLPIDQAELPSLGLPAVKKNQVYLYGNAFEDEFVMEDPYSLEQQLDTIVGLLQNNKP
jgi:iron complex transport system substrate-binding protein